MGDIVYLPVRRELTEHGISCDGHAAHQLTARDYAEYDQYDLLISMEDADINNTLRISVATRRGRCTACSTTPTATWYTGHFGRHGRMSR